MGIFSKKKSEEPRGNNPHDLFVELAKAKSAPAPVKLETEAAAPAVQDDGEGQLTVDVYQDKDSIVVQSTVAGVDPENLEINITNESVTIRGKRERQQVVEDHDYFYQECFWGSFSRSVILPHEVDPEESTATLKNGVLTIRLPKLMKNRAKKLKVKLD
ncbi:MAG: Hsp20/alpha crystallin family protein [bacterium]|nr:Hsp20/alpha crystallin family protein [bacterium]